MTNQTDSDIKPQPSPSELTLAVLQITANLLETGHFPISRHNDLRLALELVSQLHGTLVASMKAAEAPLIEVNTNE